ncbi:hypothetical protein DDB_G0270748 [Dictyostelium discoideum AX4]|uniref:Uncharacterized protein n=1 Tax=Dictyostelium discoideum TaxID=44689 RepID=Q55C88_DICDI|nr:hypothetical protein DDB_G0270748 [Dictyostelium discoideum AX4]EAL72724.1 hypothetical protein DDB_G0270748 [Dictyostelium discoideum AX4]|eukprot:XP_646593.1 hypothetical protein DDB_G0270748 [Dictyostelium discoideum AX4]
MKSFRNHFTGLKQLFFFGCVFMINLIFQKEGSCRSFAVIRELITGQK